MSNIFGNPSGSNTASGGTGGGIFGTNLTAGNTGGTTTGGLFGSAPKPAQGGGLFGASSNTGGGGLFGAASSSTTPTGGGLFGAPSGSTPAPATGGLFGASSGTTPAATGGGLFGSSTPSSTTANATAPAPSTNPLFGGSSAFGLPASAAKPASPFGLPSTSTAALGATPAPALGGGLFGAKPAATTSPAPTLGSGASSTSTSATPAPAAGSSLFGGGGLFGKPATPAPTTTTPAATGSGTTPAATTTGGGLGFSLGGASSSTTPAPSGGLFGKPAEPAPSGGLFGKPAEKDDKAAPAANASLSGGLFGAPKPDDKKEGSTGLSGGLSLGIGKPAEASASTNTAPVVAVPPPSMLRGKTIEEIVNKWSSELETHVREFNKFAAEVSMWDRALIENGNHLSTLYSHVLAAEREQNEVDQSLDHIEQQQKDLAATLDSYEKVTEEIFGSAGGSLRALDTGPADTERDKNYMLATDLHTHLDDLSNSLTQMIDSVNSLSIPAGSDSATEDPMTQISQILSTHLESLQWIDGAVREVEGKVTEVEKRVRESGHSPALNGSTSKSRGFGLR